MKFSPSMKSRWSVGGAVLGLASALVLCSCEDKEAAPAAPAEEPAVAAEQKAPQEPELSALRLAMLCLITLCSSWHRR